MPHVHGTITVKAFVKKGDSILLLRNIDGSLDLPGGRMDEGEEILPIEDVLRRELREELGQGANISIDKIADAWVYKHTKLGNLFQLVFLCIFIDGEIVLDGKEHTDFVWVSKKDVSSLTVSDRFKNSILKYL